MLMYSAFSVFQCNVMYNILKVVTQFKIADTKKFDKTITLEDKLEALR